MSRQPPANRLPLDAVLRSRRCRYRFVSEDDVEHSWTATRQPGFNDGMLWEAPTRRDELRGHTQELAERWHAGEAYAFTVETESDGACEFVDRIAIRRMEEPDVWNLGFWIHPRLWRRGYATEAAARMLELGFDTLNARRIEAAAAIWNEPSWRVLDRIGMQRMRVNPHGFRKRGAWVTEYEYAVDRPDGSGWPVVSPGGS